MSMSIGSEAVGAVLKDALLRNGIAGLGVGVTGGAVADVLTPIGPAASYLFYAAAIACAILVVTVMVRRVLAVKLLPALFFAVVVAMLSGGLWQLQAAYDAKEGILAETVPMVRDVQRRLGVVQADVASIREGVGRIESSVGRVELRQGRVESQVRQANETAARTEQQVARVDSVTREVERRTAAIQTSLEDVARAFRELSARSTGLVDNPLSPAEYYHNARLLEQRGDGLGARRAYLQVASAGLDAIDVYQRLATVLRVQDGRAGAREVVAALAERNPSPALALVLATLFDGEARSERLTTFASANAGYAPVHLFMADEVSEARLGSQTIDERRREREALARFLEAEAGGDLARHVLDPSVIGEWTESARNRLQRIDRAIASGPAEPNAMFIRSNAGWTMSVVLPEPALDLSYRVAASEEFRSTRESPILDPRTGRPMPNLNVALPRARDAMTIDVAYTDIRGRRAGPFPIRFDPDSALFTQQRQQLEMVRGSWVAFPERTQPRMFYTLLVTTRCALRAATFGIDGAEPTTALRLPPCDRDEPFAIPSGFLPIVAVPAQTASVRVRLTYADGSTSEETFERR